MFQGFVYKHFGFDFTYRRRRWLYAFGEVGSAGVFALCFSVLFKDRGYVIGMIDPGMARITALCLMIITGITFSHSVILKKQDRP